MIARFQILDNLYNEYFPKLVDSQTLLEALKDLPQDMLIAVSFENIQANLPPVIRELTIRERVKQLQDQVMVLEHRVKAIKEAMKKEQEIDLLETQKWEEKKRIWRTDDNPIITK